MVLWLVTQVMNHPTQCVAGPDRTGSGGRVARRKRRRLNTGRCAHRPLLAYIGKGDSSLNTILNDQSLIYLQIAKMLEDGILHGDWPEGSQVPSTNELARSLRINPATAAKGINQLVEEGILYKRRGIGMFVADGAATRINQKRKAAFYHQFVQPLAVEAKSLDIARAELETMLDKAFSHKEE